MAHFCAAATGPPDRSAWCIIPPPLTLANDGEISVWSSQGCRGHLFGSLVLRLPLRPDPTRETLATDGHEIRYSPRWIAETEAHLIETTMAQVVMACALKHHTRRGERDPERWQMASQLSGAARQAGDAGCVCGGRLDCTSGEGVRTAVAGREVIEAVDNVRRIAASARRVMQISHAILERQHRGSRARRLREEAGA